jgi:(1->4)-alpha-D-glucan 1-alpha-D-glucosylmutase
LGITHLYASPWLKARPGSTHGYDIVDHNALNPELGGEPAFVRLREALETHGLKHILDFVPNHMGVGGSDNPVWLDILEWGRHSAYAGWIDVDWKPERPYIHNKLLVPFLGDQYGIALAKGDLALKWDADAGTFAVWAYHAHKLPICPLSYDRVLGIEHAELERIGDAFVNLSAWHPHSVRRAADLKAELSRMTQASDAVREAVEAAVARVNDTPGDLNVLIQEQHWRVAHFRVAADDINYRRFFNINDLAALRMEVPEVFEHTHHFVLELLRSGHLDGLRIDHLDGLLDPKEYLARLRSSLDRPFYLVVEKILAHHESLPEEWPIDGTTGYDFANLVLGLFVDRKAEEKFTRIYNEFAGPGHTFPEIVRASKTRIMENEMASELHVPRSGGSPDRSAESKYVGLHLQYSPARASGSVDVFSGLSYLSGH